MVPPVKPAAPPVRTSAPPAASAPRDRLLAFKALLMAPAKPKPAAPPPKPAVRGAETPSPGKAASHAAKAGPDDKRSAGVGAKPLAIDDEKPKTAKAKPTVGDKEGELLDPSTRLAAQLAPPLASSAPTTAEHVTQRARVSLEELVPHVLRRIAWGGDRTKGSVHLELASGDKVTVFAEGRRVRIEVDGNPDLEARIGSRLRAAGIEVEGVR